MPHAPIIILFTKSPAGGRVKTRLAADLGGDFALRLHEAMLLDTIDTLKKCGFPFRLCIHPAGAIEETRTRIGKEYDYMPQADGDLGERMERAFTRVFSEGFKEAVLIGSDIPGLSSGMLHEAFEALGRHDAVIGPANDGGYYLIGFTGTTFYPAVFHSIRWSTGTVFRETMGRFADAARRVHVLPECIDVDTRKDLEMLLQQQEDPIAATRTLSLLRRHRPSLAE